MIKNPTGTEHVPMHDMGPQPGTSSSGTAPAITGGARPTVTQRQKSGVLGFLQPRTGARTVASVYAQTPLSATQAHAPVAPSGREADADATTPILTERHRRRTLQMPVEALTEGHRAGNAEAAGTVFDIAAFFPPAKGAAKTSAKGAPGSVPTPANEDARATLQRELEASFPGPDGHIAGMALASACDGDVARALKAFHVLRDGEATTTDEHAHADAFAIACRLSATGVGLDILHALRCPAGPGSASSSAAVPSDREKAIQLQADMTAHQAAERLLAVWPAGVSRPNSLTELAHVCNALTGMRCDEHLAGDLRADFQRTAETHESASLLSNTDAVTVLPELANSALAREPIAMHALLAAVMLREQPAMALDGSRKALALPYLAARNQIYDQDALDSIGARLFKMLTYTDRAAENPAAQAARGLSGKNPLAALSGGTGGQLMREPETDFAGVATAVGRVVDALEASIVGHPGGPEVANADVRTAMRAAILDQWVTQIGEGRWQDRTTIALTADSAVMTRVAEMLHLDEAGMAALRRRPIMAAFGESIVMTPARLRQWADDVMPDRSQPGGPEMDAGLAHVDHMKDSGDVFPAEANANDYLMAVRRSIAQSRMTYGVRSNERRDLGFNFNVNFLARSKKAPVVALGPAVRGARRVGADVYAGSTALAGALEMTSQRGWTGWAGLSAIASWTPTSFFGGSVAGTVLPFVGEQASFEGAAIRTRFQPPDVESWRTTLLEAFDSMYGVKQPADPGGHPVIEPPANAQALLDNLASTHATAPDLSLGRVSGSSINIGSSVAVSGSARFRSPKASDQSRGGPSGTITQAWSWLSRRKVNDDDGGLKTQVVNQTSSTNTSATLNLSLSLPGTGTSNGSAVFTPINLLSASVVMFPMSRGGTLRFSMDNGKVASTTAYDTEFARLDDFEQYTDSRRGEWLRWTRTEADDAEGATGNPTQRLDEYLERVRDNAKRGGLVLAERIVMQPAARERMDQLLAAFAYAEALPRDQRDARRAALRGALDTLVDADDSWGPRFLYVNEINGERTELGPNYLVDAVATQEVTTARQTSAFRAQDVPRDPPPDTPRETPPET